MWRRVEVGVSRVLGFECLVVRFIGFLKGIILKYFKSFLFIVESKV